MHADLSEFAQHLNIYEFFSFLSLNSYLLNLAFMASICFYFQVHQPYRIKKYRVFDVGNDHEYFNDRSDRDINNENILHNVVKQG